MAISKPNEIIGEPSPSQLVQIDENFDELFETVIPLPTPTPTDAGKVLGVGPDGAYVLIDLDK